MISPTRSAAIVLRQLYLMRSSPARVLPLFVWVAIDIVLWGFITKYLNNVSNSGINFVPTLLGAVLLWDFFTRVMHGVTTAFFEDVWSRNFLNFFATPMAISDYVTGLVVTSILTSIVGLIVMLVLASFVFGLSFFVYGAMFVPFLLILFVFGISLGILGCSVVLRYGPASEWFIWPIPALLSPFVGVFYPISVLPRWMQGLAHFLPPAYVFEGMRAILEHRHFAGTDLLIGAGLSLVCLFLTYLLFVRVYRRAVRSGLIARYSAETLA